jgi:hypothetical protein
MLSVNVLLEKNPNLEQLKLNAQLLVAPVNQAYAELCGNVFRLDMWIKVS